MNTAQHAAVKGLEERSVKPFELFFDLVFVFAFTQVTQSVAAEMSWASLGRGMLVLAALWWSWVVYAWLATTTDLEVDSTRLAMVPVMGAMLVAAMAVPDAFGGSAVQFACAYLFVRVMHIVLYLQAGRMHHNRELVRQVSLFAPAAVVGPAIILGAAIAQPDTMELLWLVALAVDYGSLLVGRGRGWVVSPSHFAERHGLIVIVALGEAIISIGAGAAGLELDAEVMLGALLGFAAIVSMWWLYFDVVALAAERRLHAARGAAQNRMARDGYSYFHLPMIAGLIAFSLGAKKVMAHPHDTVSEIGGAVLFGGLALYLLGSALLRWRFIRTVSRPRFPLMIALFALAAATPDVAGITALALAAGAFVALVTFERVRYRQVREGIRSGAIAFHDPKGTASADRAGDD